MTRLLPARPWPSPVLTAFRVRSQIAPQSPPRASSGKAAGAGRLEFPKVFSFIDAPDEAVALLRRLAAVAAHPRTTRLQFDQSACESIDLCAEAVCSVLAREACDARKISVGGIPPRAPLARDIVYATGLPHYLGVRRESRDDFLPLGILHGQRRKERPYASSQREVIADRLTTYFDDCLYQYGYGLSRKGKHYLASIAGEVIGNAEDHAGEPDWWVAAYLHQASDTAYGDCHITIFNFGRTLHETMSTLPPQSYLRQRIDALVREHGRRGLWRRHWTEENLWTLYALQEGASRYQADASEWSDRGQGTADLIEFFQHLGGSQSAGEGPKMCVVSGRTHLLFDTTYPMRREVTGPGWRRRIVALNKSNDLREPPDRRYVRCLEHPFPGTLISLRFFLDHDYLNASQQPGHDGHRRSGPASVKGRARVRRPGPREDRA